jgi:hypothetical protein
VKALGKLFSSMFTTTEESVSKNERIHREWDRARMRSMSPSETSEIDAIFSRNLV